MNMSEFIRYEMDAILEEWEQFARSLCGSEALDPRVLRDHAREMLARVADDMEEPQSRKQQVARSRGERDTADQAADSAAQRHGGGRLTEGFTMPETVAEFRALRASIVRRWIDHGPVCNEAALRELTRFHDAIDQALSESVQRFHEKLSRARQLFMGTLSHDLRSPLQVIVQSADALRRSTTPGPKQAQLPIHIADSAAHIGSMLDDLLDVARTKLGGTLPIQRRETDLGEVCCAVLNELRAAHPNVNFELNVAPNIHGKWDAGRLNQLLTNLLRNAVQHGDVERPISLSATSQQDRAYLAVHNFGEPIPSRVLGSIFDPLTRGEKDDTPPTASLGLGLYIARTIAEAHGGTLSVDSSREHGTKFTVCLPAQSTGP